MAGPAFCERCGAALDAHGECERAGRPGSALDPPRFCVHCGGRMTIQVLPGAYEASCLGCERRARFAAARG
jgi:hypothetical protein